MFQAAFAVLAVLPQNPVTLSPKDVAMLFGHGSDRHSLLKTLHGKQIRLIGRLSVWQGDIEISAPDSTPSSKHHRLRVQFANPKDREAVRKWIEKNAAAKLSTVLTLVGQADFLRNDQRPAPDYVVPEELRPRSQVRVLTGQELWEAMLAAGNIDPRILEDARRKGKLVTVESTGLYWLKAARWEVSKGGR